MKTKTLISFFFSLVVAFSFSACDDDAEIILFSGSQLIDEAGTCTNTVSSLTLYLNGDESADIGIANGKGDYSAQSSDESVVTATVSNDRLLLKSHGKKGKITVTVSDKKGNSVVLPVEVKYGVMSMDYYESGFRVVLDGEIMNQEDDKELFDAVNETMSERYAFIPVNSNIALQPNNINQSVSERSGSFVLHSKDGAVLAEGTYQSTYEEFFVTGNQECAFTFKFDKNGVKQSHKFYVNPKSRPATKSTGPQHIEWVEEVPSEYLQDIPLLPAGARVIYVVIVRYWGLR